MIISDAFFTDNYYDLHLTQALRGLAWVKIERIAGR